MQCPLADPKMSVSTNVLVVIVVVIGRVWISGKTDHDYNHEP
jgi:hypothetical protein